QSVHFPAHAQLQGLRALLRGRLQPSLSCYLSAFPAGRSDSPDNAFVGGVPGSVPTLSWPAPVLSAHNRRVRTAHSRPRRPAAYDKPPYRFGYTLSYPTVSTAR